jgi:O-acetyl-ADP-ribose deacetylase (regulator of RNase III)
MPVEYRSGDLFSTESKALAHGCNCQGVMGAGIAVKFKERYPQMFEHYRQGCVMMRYQPGDVMVYHHNPTGVYVFNLMTQPKPGRTAKLEYIRSALKKALWRCEQDKLPALAMPRIGAGLGGLEWEKVQEVIEELGKETPVTILVYSL